MSSVYRDIDKDSIISSLQEENKKLKDAIRGNEPYWGVKVISVSIDENNKECPYSITIEFSAGAKVSLNLREENLKALGNPTAGSKLNLFLFPINYFTDAGFYKD